MEPEQERGMSGSSAKRPLHLKDRLELPCTGMV